MNLISEIELIAFKIHAKSFFLPPIENIVTDRVRKKKKKTATQNILFESKC